MCAIKASHQPGGFFGLGCFSFQQKIRNFTACDDDDVFVELPK